MPALETVRPPHSEEELMTHARELAGRQISELAQAQGRPVPRDQRRAKGWLGQLLESYLGGTAASRSEPDFPHLGIELKTLPVDDHGRPRESTYVCTVPLRNTIGLTWGESCVCRKLRRVLWIPLQARPDLPLHARRIGSPLLWSPDPEDEAALRSDWNELMELVCFGRHGELSAHHGRYLQIRPKAAHSRALQPAVGETGEEVLTLPRGFYLRTCFTAAILRAHFVLSPGQ